VVAVRAEVEDAAGRVEHPHVGIPLLDCRREPAVGLGEPLDGGDGLGAGEDVRDLVLVALRSGLPADLPR
jgi:hypothetical protein